LKYFIGGLLKLASEGQKKLAVKHFLGLDGLESLFGIRGQKYYEPEHQPIKSFIFAMIAQARADLN
jgi:hypothetical protein